MGNKHIVPILRLNFYFITPSATYQYNTVSTERNVKVSAKLLQTTKFMKKQPLENKTNLLLLLFFVVISNKNSLKYSEI